MAVLVSNMAPSVVAELNLRRAFLSSQLSGERHEQMMQFQHGRVPWIRMQSNAMFEYPHPLAGKQVGRTLSSAWAADDESSKFESVYDNAYLKPRAGITGLSSVIKGHLGMLREVTVSFRANTLEQLETLHELFMIPGIGVLVEWGWSVGDAASLHLNLDNLKPGPNDRWLANVVRDNVKRGGGRYDAIYGLICNYDIRYVDDNTWDCSTTIVGPGAMTVDMNLKSPSNAMDDRLIMYIESRVAQYFEHGEPKLPVCGRFTRISDELSVAKSQAEEQRQSMLKNLPGLFSSEIEKAIDKAEVQRTNLYVTWYFIEMVLNGFFSEAEPSNYAGKHFIWSAITRDDEADKYYIPVSNFRYGNLWRSFNPTDVLIPQHPVGIDQVDIYGSTVTDDHLMKFDSGGDVSIGNLSAVWLNYNTVVKPAFQNSDSMQEALNRILNRMNDASGGVWNLELMFDSEGYSYFRVIDTRCTHPDEKTVQPYVFSVNKNSIVRQCDLNMTIPNALKTTVMIATNAPQDIESAVAEKDKIGVFRSLSRGVRDRYAQNSAAYVPMSNDPVRSTIERNAYITDPGMLTTKFDTESINVNRGASKPWYQELTGEEKSSLINQIFRIYEKGTEGYDNQRAYIPMEATVTLDGIGGITWGNAFRIDGLPRKYSETTYFQVKNIEHSVDDNGWLTKITGLMRPAYNQSKEAKYDLEPLKQERLTPGQPPELIYTLPPLKQSK